MLNNLLFIYNFCIFEHYNKAFISYGRNVCPFIYLMQTHGSTHEVPWVISTLVKAFKGGVCNKIRKQLIRRWSRDCRACHCVSVVGNVSVVRA